MDDDRAPVGALQGLRPDLVAHVGSVSKTLAPALRLGWLIAPTAWRARLLQARESLDHGLPALEQLTEGWNVPEERILELGPRMSSFRGISHCYQRPTYPDWPYSVFTMAHGRSKEECDAILQSIADEHGLHGEDRATLYSSTEFKKIRLHYFTPEYAEWERANS